MNDLYEDLGIAKDASDKEVKKAYKIKANKHHPDKGGDPDKFHAIALAYSVLSDSERRKQYDKNGTTQKERTPQAIAEEILFKWIDEIFDQEFTPKNILRELHDRIAKGTATVNHELKKINFKRARLEKLIGRVTRSVDHISEENFFESILDKKINDCSDRIERLEKDLVVSLVMKDLLKGFRDGGMDNFVTFNLGFGKNYATSKTCIDPSSC